MLSSPSALSAPHWRGAQAAALGRNAQRAPPRANAAHGLTSKIEPQLLFVRTVSAVPAHRPAPWRRSHRPVELRLHPDLTPANRSAISVNDVRHRTPLWSASARPSVPALGRAASTL